MRDIPDPGFPGDTGAASEGVTGALAAYAEDPAGGYARTLAVLQGARLLVPVMAVLDDVEHDDDGLVHDKSSDMATVLMRGNDGRLALLAFTSTDALKQWDPRARPVPVPTAKAAEAALQDDAAAMVVDVAGPVMFVIEEHDLQALKEGYTMVDVHGRYGWAKPS
jgi:hypothetical protein